MQHPEGTNQRSPTRNVLRAATALFANLATARATARAKPRATVRATAIAGALATALSITLVVAAPARAQQAAVGATTAASQPTPIGLWKTIDDETNKPKALVRVRDEGGRLTGTIEKLFDAPEPNPVCEACKDERKGKPIIGLKIVDDVKKFDDHWGDGKILDPKTGKVYSVRMTPIEGGSKLEVRGFIGFALLGRTQTWLREE